jgi:hypothetical protein
MNKKLALSSAFALAWSVAALALAIAPQSPVSADFVRPGETETLPAAIASAVSGLRENLLAAHVAVLAAQSFEGRALGGRGLDAAAEYAASSLAVAGVAPLATGRQAEGGSPGSHAAALALASYFHEVPLLEVSRPSGQLDVTVRIGEAADSRVFHAGVDASFPETAPDVLTAPVVFAGYGIREQSPARDDYRGLDVKGRIVLILAGLPAGPEWQAPAPVARYGSNSVRQRFAAKVQLAASMGARAVLAIEGEEFGSRLASKPGMPAPTFFLPADDAGPPPTPVIQITPRAGDSLLRSIGLTTASAATADSRALPGVEATVRVTGDERRLTSRNVIGIVPGSDSRLHDEAVVIGAHVDHLGRIGETIYPGADDNASGVAALIELARAFAAAPQKPRRSVVFACWTGEEEGHLGSAYYVRHPLWPLEHTAVYLNLDMIGHPWTAQEIRQLVVDTRLDRGEEFLQKVSPADFIELGVAEWARELGPVLARAARGTGLALHLDRTDGKNGGSDYRDFARRGLPFVRFFGTYFDGYHEPTDTAGKLDTRQVLKMARLALASAWLLADQPASVRGPNGTNR